MTKNLDRSGPLTYVAGNQQAARNEERKPVLASFQVYVGTYVAPDDPGNDPPGTSPSSPAWQNGFSWVADYPIWFAHGVDGETDMGGMYDLITGSPVSGTVAFTMPLEWALEAEPFHAFPVRIEEGASVEDDIYVIAVQVIDQTSGDVRIYWPTYAFPYVT